MNKDKIIGIVIGILISAVLVFIGLAYINLNNKFSMLKNRVDIIDSFLTNAIQQNQKQVKQPMQQPPATKKE